MELWYFSPVPALDSAAVSALTARLSAWYGADFRITIFVSGGAKAPFLPTATASCDGVRCELRPFRTGADAHLQNALGPAFARSYEMRLAARAAAEECGRPDALLFPLTDAAPYYTLLDRYLDSAFWADCPIFLEEPEDADAQSPRPDYLLPDWWIAQQHIFCRRAASGLVRADTPQDAPQGAIAPADLVHAVRAARKTPFAPAEFPFLTVRPRAPVPAAASEPGLLTVIIPYYNLGATLPEALASAFAADTPSYEVLLIDDGSPDADSVRVLREMEEKYPRLRVVRQENAGLSAVRNRGAVLARGEFITFLDADDRVAPDFYRRAVALLRQYENAAYVGSWLRLFGDAEGYKAYFPSSLPALLLDNTQASGCVIRRDVFLAHGQNCTDMRAGFEDHESWIRMAENGYFGVNLPEPLYFYRLKAGSASAAFSRDESHERHIRLYQTLEEKHPALYREYSTELFNLLTANGPGYLWAGPSLPHAPVGYLTHPDAFWLHELALARADAENYKNSRAYRMGQALLHPVRALRGSRR